MNKPLFPQSKYAAPPNAEASTKHQRPRAKWTSDLHSVLAQLLEAQALASENSEPSGDVQ